ncbi:hypothetical protein GCM10027175_12770 [Hymenobacter latericoloratus]
MYGDTAVISSLDFQRQPEIELQNPTLPLTRNTTLASLATVFPYAVKAQQVLDVYQVGKRVVVTLQTAKVPNDYTWLLFFHQGRLESIELHTPC